MDRTSTTLRYRDGYSRIDTGYMVAEIGRPSGDEGTEAFWQVVAVAVLGVVVVTIISVAVGPVPRYVLPIVGLVVVGLVVRARRALDSESAQLAYEYWRCRNTLASAGRLPAIKGQWQVSYKHTAERLNCEDWPMACRRAEAQTFQQRRREIAEQGGYVGSLQPPWRRLLATAPKHTTRNWSSEQRAAFTDGAVEVWDRDEPVFLWRIPGASTEHAAAQCENCTICIALTEVVDKVSRTGQSLAAMGPPGQSMHDRLNAIRVARRWGLIEIEGKLGWLATAAIAFKPSDAASKAIQAGLQIALTEAGEVWRSVPILLADAERNRKMIGDQYNVYGEYVQMVTGKGASGVQNVGGSSLTEGQVVDLLRKILIEFPWEGPNSNEDRRVLLDAVEQKNPRRPGAKRVIAKLLESVTSGVVEGVVAAAVTLLAVYYNIVPPS
jgi:hypothetical protein